MKTKNIATGLLIFIGLWIFFFVWRSCSDVTQVIHKEFDASALLSKYEYYKNVSSSLDKKRADLSVYQEELQSMLDEYGSTSKMPKDERETYNLRKSEVLGIVSSYNELASDYNAQMSKFNWSFCNKGQLPASNLEPLPREYKPFILSISNPKNK